MGEQLKIDSDEAYGMAAELASLQGESIEAVVTRVLREALERDRKARDEEKVTRIRANAAEIRASLPHPLPFSDHDYLYGYLYDDDTESWD